MSAEEDAIKRQVLAETKFLQDNPTGRVADTFTGEPCCDDWVDGVENINKYIWFMNVRAGRDLYDGKPFRFCPWCGTERPL